MTKLPQKAEVKNLVTPRTMYFLTGASGLAAFILVLQEMIMYNLLAAAMLPIMLATWMYGKILSKQEKFEASAAEFDRFLLKFARQHRGVVFISHLVSEHDITIEEAEYHLDRLASKGYARFDFDIETGVSQYIFPEFQTGHLQEIDLHDRLNTLSRELEDSRSFPQQVDIAGGYYSHKKRVTAGFLAIFLGGFGVHKFYLGKTGKGILYVIFWWTYIPSLIGLVEGIIMLSQSDAEFVRKQGLKLESGSRIYLPPKR